MITIIAPFPKQGEVMEGWMSRIAAVDRIFNHERRVYVQVVDDGTANLPEPYVVSDLVEVYYLNLSLLGHYDKLRSLILAAEMVYVHTIHLARFVLPFYKTKKIVTDIHGITPEEECLYDKPGHGSFYEAIERTVLTDSHHAVVVTNAMAEHYRNKYPDSKCEFTVLPIFETTYQRADQRLTLQEAQKRPRVLYSGGAQKWQKVDLMLDLAKAQVESCDFTFLSHEFGEFQDAARARGIEDRVSFQSAKKEDLAAFYLDADFGLVLRDDIAVNRVACPTKLSEYLWFGVIPIVLSPDLGDFRSLGYRYIDHQDFLNGKLPTVEVQKEMRAKNFEVISSINDSFEAAAAKVMGLKSRMPKCEYALLEFLTDLERNVVYPALSELHLTLRGDTEPSQVLNQYFMGPFRNMKFDIPQIGDVKRLTWMPINRECQIRLNTVVIETVTGSSSPYKLSGNFDDLSNGVATFSARYPRIHFDIDANMKISKFTAQFDIVYTGSEMPGLSLFLHQQQQQSSVQRLKSYSATFSVFRALHATITAATSRLRAVLIAR